MVANVETMFSVREVPWHKLGLILDTAPTAAEAIKLAGLDWSVEKWPLFAAMPMAGGDILNADEFRATVRSTDRSILGVVGKGYEPVQNVEAFDFCDPLIKAGKITLETAGSLGGGRRVWVLAKVGTADVVAGDPVNQYLLLTFGHDGIHGVKIKPTGVRVVCQNTVNAALADGVQAISLRHTTSVHASLEEVSAMFERAQVGFEESVSAWRRMAAKQITSADMDAYVLDLVPKEETVKDARREMLRSGLKLAFENAPGNSLAGVRGTMWAAYNAVTWHATHEGGRRKDDEGRLDSMWFGSGAGLMKRAYDRALVLAA